jgi:glutamyl-tRNA synthetase
MDRPSTKVALERALDVLSQTESFDAAATDAELRPLAATLSIKAGQLFGSIRVATTGLRVAPPLFESLEILGRDRSLASIKSAADRL